MANVVHAPIAELPTEPITHPAEPTTTPPAEAEPAAAPPYVAEPLGTAEQTPGAKEDWHDVIARKNAKEIREKFAVETRVILERHGLLERYCCLALMEPEDSINAFDVDKVYRALQRVNADKQHIWPPSHQSVRTPLRSQRKWCTSTRIMGSLSILRARWSDWRTSPRRRQPRPIRIRFAQTRPETRTADPSGRP